LRLVNPKILLLELVGSFTFSTIVDDAEDDNDWRLLKEYSVMIHVVE
jgi:hypothetical protein